jgi:hypothetical protein
MNPPYDISIASTTQTTPPTQALSFQLRLSQLSRRTDRSVDVVLLNEEDNDDRANKVSGQ